MMAGRRLAVNIGECRIGEPIYFGVYGLSRARRTKPCKVSPLPWLADGFLAHGATAVGGSPPHVTGEVCPGEHAQRARNGQGANTPSKFKEKWPLQEASTRINKEEILPVRHGSFCSGVRMLSFCGGGGVRMFSCRAVERLRSGISKRPHPCFQRRPLP